MISRIPARCCPKLLILSKLSDISGILGIITGSGAITGGMTGVVITGVGVGVGFVGVVVVVVVVGIVGVMGVATGVV